MNHYKFKVNSSQATVKLTNNRLNKIMTGSKLRITKRNFRFKEWPYELFLTTRQENQNKKRFR